MTAASRFWARAGALVTLLWMTGLPGVHAQQTPPTPAALGPVPRVVWFNGSFRPADGQPLAAVEIVTLAIYRDQQTSEPLWEESQRVAVERDGHYHLLLGAGTPDGLPADLFTASEARWLGIRFIRPGEREQPRVLLASVPYALKAADADTLGGKPASAYRLVPTTATAEAAVAAPAVAGSALLVQPNTVGTAGHIGRFIDAANLGDSVMVQASVPAIGGSGIGLGTIAPKDALHVAFTNTNGGVTGYAVQNLSGAAGAFSGMLFYDQNGALTQFQGFNNATHEYRINNIASGGTINFMVGGSSRFFVATNGNIGIGTAAPTAKLQVAGDVTVSGNIAAKYQDVAEWVETPSPMDAGTVVIIDPAQANRVLASPKAYDTRVAGAVSRQPGLVLGERGDTKVIVAQSGRVVVKADATYGAIRIGDLLVTSPTPGYAMRSRPVRVGEQSMHRPGTLLGKALEPLAAGKGEILVLLTLQ